MSITYCNILEHAVEEDRIIDIAMTMSPKRFDNETMEEYRLRRGIMKEGLKDYKKGTLAYDPFKNGRFTVSNSRIVRVPGVPFVKNKGGEDRI